MNNFNTELYPHQQLAFEKLKSLKVGALFMEMGTGKTRTIFEIFDYKYSKGKVNKILYICPFSTITNIEKQFNIHFKVLPKYNIFAYESLQSSDRIYLEIINLVDEKTFLVLDESHFIKNVNRKRTKRILQLGYKTQYRFILTGTPAPKHAGDLYSQFSFLDKRIIGYCTYNSFVKNHLIMDELKRYVKKSHNLDYITSKILPYLYQVKKSECLTLPDKCYHQKTAHIKEDEELFYKEEKERILNKIYDLASVSEGIIFSLYTTLQKICDLCENKYVQLIETIKEINAKTIIYFKFIRSLDLAKEILIKNGYDVYEYSGKIPYKERTENENKWKNSEKGILLITYGTGAFSLNLQESSNIIFMNLTFDYSRKKQAEDRIHRIGQNNNCTYTEIITNAGIERIICKSIDKKINFIHRLTQEINAIKNNKEIDNRKELKLLWEKYT